MTEKNKAPNYKRIVIGPVRLSFVEFAEAKLDEEKGTYHYSCQVLVPTADKEAIAKIKRATLAATVEKFGKEKTPRILKSPKFHTPLRDPVEEELEHESFKGMMFFSCKAGQKRRPGYALKNRTRLTDPAEIAKEFYSGVWAYVSLNFYYFDKNSKGIAVGLNNVLKSHDDESLEGGSKLEDDFEHLFEDDEFSEVGNADLSDTDDPDDNDDLL